MKIITHARPNIAFIKYWGNRNEELRLPVADSLSMTLSEPSVKIEMEEADMMNVRSIEKNGEEKNLSEAQKKRFIDQFTLAKKYLHAIGAENALPENISLVVRSEIPSGIGLASSAAVFAATAGAYAEMAKEVISLTKKQTSVIARLGSGSASRSIFDGFAAFIAGGDGIGDAWAEQIADENHWPLHDIVIAPEIEHKKVGSTEGHALASTSPHWEERVRQMPRRQKECIDAILKKDFEKLQRVTEEDCMDMHNVMMTSTPSLQYLNKETYRIVKEIENLRSTEHLEALYTMDAGPTVHVICTEDALEKIREYVERQKSCTVFEAKAGKGVSAE